MTTAINPQEKTVNFNSLNTKAQDNAYQAWLNNPYLRPSSSSNSFFLDMLLSELKDKGVIAKKVDVQDNPAKAIEVTQVKSDYSDYNLMNLKGVRAVKVVLALYYRMTERPVMYGYLKDEYINDYTASNISRGFYADYFKKYRYSRGLWKTNLRLEIDRIASAFLQGLHLSIVLDKSKTVKQHLELALTLASEEVVERDSYITSKQYFIDCVSHKHKFSKDGTIIH